MALAQAAALAAQLRALVMTPGADVQTGKAMLTQLKLLMTEFPSQTASSGVVAPKPDEIEVARDILENGALLSVRLQDGKGMERAWAQLQPYYSGAYAESPARAESRRHVLGLYLLHLLVESRLPEFHSQVELLRPGDRGCAPVAFSLRLETFLMDGSYNKIVGISRAGAAGLPSPFYEALVGRLLSTVRDEIAETTAAAFASLPLASALSMLMMGSAEELQEYIMTHKPEWSIIGATLQLRGAAGCAGPALAATPSAAAAIGGEEGSVMVAQEIIRSTLSYAAEIERIV